MHGLGWAVGGGLCDGLGQETDCIDLWTCIWVKAQTILAATLYGSEVGQGGQKELRALRTAIVNTIGTISARKCVDVVFETCGHHIDLDPAVQQLARKVLLLRRSMA